MEEKFIARKVSEKNLYMILSSTGQEKEVQMSLEQRLELCINSTPGGKSHVCVGLDPQEEKTLPRDIVNFNSSIVDATIDYSCAYKLNSAFYEAVGLIGAQALKATIEYIRYKAPHAFVILDSKRGDVYHTAEQYAYSAFSFLGVDAVTVNPYLGEDGVKPFIEKHNQYAFVLCRTSNPMADEIQNVMVENSNGEKAPYYLYIASLVKKWSLKYENAGLVVGATATTELANIVESYPRLPILLPGVGAQGGDLEESVKTAKKGSFIINSSRSIIYSNDPGGSTRDLRDKINKELE